MVSETGDKPFPDAQADIPYRPFGLAGWRVEPATLRISRGETVRKLEPRVMQVLAHFAARPGSLVTREELEAHVWQGRVVGYDAVATTVIKLRKAFGDDSRNPRVIETIPKTGYRLIAGVEVLAPAGEAPGDGPALQDVSAGSQHPIQRFTVPAMVLLGAAVAWLVWLATQSPDHPTGVADMSALPSVAVLPFDNADSNDEQQYFADGITEDLITDLSSVPGLLVVARNSVFAYQNSHEPEQRIGRELGARYLLKGYIRKREDRLRINVRLVDAAVGRVLWAERFDRQLSGLFEIQDQIANQVIRALEIELEPRVEARLKRSYVTSIQAYDEFLRGIDFYGRRSEADVRAAMAHFQRAIELDPRFARAYSGLALTYTRLVGDALNHGDLSVLDKAEELVRQALALDRDVPQVYFVESQVQLYRGDLEGALRTIEKAVELKPSYADGYGMMAWILHFAGRPREGLRVMAVAERLNPGLPSVYLLVKGANQYAVGNFRQSVDTLTRAAQVSPHHPLIRLWLAAANAADGRLDDAQWEIEELRAQNPAFSLADVRAIYPFKDPQYLQRLLGDLQQAGFAD